MSEPVAAVISDPRGKNSWLASYACDAARGLAVRETRCARRSSPPAVRKLRLRAGAAAAVASVLGIGFTAYVAATEVSARPGHYPLDQSGGIAVSSANLDRYLATLEERATARQFLLTFGDLPFAAGSTQIGDREKSELARMADFLRAHPQTVAQITGYADDRSDEAVNSRLAERRAAAVRSYLLVRGIEQSRLTVLSGAEDQPLAENPLQAGRAGNRRVEILVRRSQPEQLR